MARELPSHLSHHNRCETDISGDIHSETFKLSSKRVQAIGQVHSPTTCYRGSVRASLRPDQPRYCGEPALVGIHSRHHKKTPSKSKSKFFLQQRTAIRRDLDTRISREDQRLAGTSEELFNHIGKVSDGFRGCCAPETAVS